MGAVWVADDVTLHSQVAIKLLHGSVQSEDGLKRFLREAQAAARLRSPHVVQIIEHGVDDDVPFIAMELLEGESLASRLARLSTLSLAQTSRIVTHVARAITKAHDAGITHRDLKPDNIFIVHNDDDEIVKVLDFGIAKMEHVAETAANVSTEAGALLGTPYYMSPEQVRGHGVDWRSDLWSLAMIAFECVCGRLPFEGRTVGDVLVLICSEPLPVPSTFRPLPPAFDAWFAKAATRTPDGRFQSAKEMADALRAIVGEETHTPDPSASGPIQRAADDARTLDANSVRELESARTVSVGGTMDGASSAVRPTVRKPWRLAFVAAAATAGVLGVAAWIAWARTSTPPTTNATSAQTPATTQPAIPTISASAAAATSAPVTPIASATASATPHPATSTPRVRTTPTQTTTQTPKTDELTF